MHMFPTLATSTCALVGKTMFVAVVSTFGVSSLCGTPREGRGSEAAGDDAEHSCRRREACSKAPAPRCACKPFGELCFEERVNRSCEFSAEQTATRACSKAPAPRCACRPF